MKTSNFFVTKYRLIQKKYNKLKLRYIKGVGNSALDKSRLQELRLKLQKCERQLNELGMVLGRAGKKGMLIGSLALGLTISACDSEDDVITNLFPDKIDLETLKLAATTGTANPLDGIDIGFRSAPTFVDIDGDGDLDLFIGENSGNFNYYKNTGSSTSATMTVQTGANNPFNGIDIGSNSRISFGDIDGDGDLDAITGDSGGGIEYYKNTGSSTAPAFTKQTSDHAFTGLSDNIGSYGDYNLHPVLVDIDNDGDLDLLMAAQGYGDYDNNTSSYTYTQQIRYFKNTGSKASPAFTEQTGSNNPASAITVNYETKIHFADLDRDGDLDLTVAYYASPYILKVFENTGSQASPSFTELTSTNSPVSSISVPYDAVPTSADIDGDGDLDFFLGQSNGTVMYFKNTTGE
jgi:hypothetical protein